MCNRILVDHLNAQLLPDKTPSTLPAEQVLGSDSLLCCAIKMRQLDFDGISLVSAIVLESLDRPRPLDFASMCLNISNKRPLNHALVEQSGERVSCVDELGTASPGTGSMDALLGRIPESNLIYLCRFVIHNLGLETHVSQEFQ